MQIFNLVMKNKQVIIILDKRQKIKEERKDKKDGKNVLLSKNLCLSSSV